ncbi:hypothetical protein E2C01_085409 [Portunus trituberculatus]|uniref:Uncharacterized protein n=1 Tax=Portunus trituberculatus TaxID=210409 RepID=A0A5B7J2L8_PORTR|nr:hypothetical protein [Portunus trituberculatus]
MRQSKTDMDNGYNIWKRDRVGKGGGVMMMLRKDIVVNQVECGEGKAEVLYIKIHINKKELAIIVTYVPPKTNSWTNQEYKDMKEESLRKGEK